MSEKKTKTYTAEFKESTVKLAVESDKPVSVTARELEVNTSTLHTWIAKYHRPRAVCYSPDGRWLAMVLTPNGGECGRSQVKIYEIKQSGPIAGHPKGRGAHLKPKAQASLVNYASNNQHKQVRSVTQKISILCNANILLDWHETLESKRQELREKNPLELEQSDIDSLISGDKSQSWLESVMESLCPDSPEELFD